MFLKIGLSKNGTKFYCIGYYEHNIPIIVSFKITDVVGICNALGFTIPDECGTYKII